VVADIVDVVRALTLDVENRVPYLGFQDNAIIDLPILPREEIETTYYLRLTVEDKPGALADITNILATQNISIEALIQKEPQHGETMLPIIMLTQKTIEREMDTAIAAIENLSSVTGQVTRIRLESLG